MDRQIEIETSFKIAIGIMCCIPLMIPMVAIVDYELAAIIYIYLIATAIMEIARGLELSQYEIID